MDATTDEVFAVINKNTKSTLFIGSNSNCEIKCNQFNVIAEGTFIIVKHEANDYITTLINKQNSSKAFKTNGTIKIHLPQKHNPPPRMIPEPTIKERVTDYLKNFKTA